MINTVNVKSMEIVRANSANSNSAEKSKAEGNDFQNMINKVSSTEQQDKQEKPVVKQESKEEKKEKQEVQELKPGEVIPLMDLLVEKPVTVDQLQAVLEEIPKIPDVVSGIGQTEGSVGTDTNILSETVLVNPDTDKTVMQENLDSNKIVMNEKPDADKVVTHEKPDVLQPAQKEIAADTVFVKETSTENQVASQSKLDHAENLRQTKLNQINQANQASQIVEEVPAKVVKTGNSEIVSSLPKTEIQPKSDKVNQEALLPKSEISTTEPQLTAQKADNVEKPQTILNPVYIQKANETDAVEKPVIEEISPKTEEASKLQTDELHTSGKTEEREVDLGSLLQQEKTGVSPFKEDIVKVKLAEPFNHLKQENVKNIADKITESINEGRREFQIQLDPENLGKIQVKISILETGIKVILSCESQKTYQLLAERSGGINQIVEQNTGSQSIVEVKEGYWNQQKDATDQHARQQGQERQEQEKASKDETNDFIQQMRLGFFDKGLVV